MMASINKLTNAGRAQVIAALVEGNSIRSTFRMTGVAKNTVVQLLVDLGRACSEYQDVTFMVDLALGGQSLLGVARAATAAMRSSFSAISGSTALAGTKGASSW